MARRKLYPMPVEALIDCPEFIAMPAAGVGIVLRLTLHFWLTECRPLPIADHELRAISRAHAPTWRHWKPSVLSVFEAIRPELEAYWRTREAKGTSLRFGSAKGKAARRANQIAAEASRAPTANPIPRREPIDPDALPRPTPTPKRSSPKPQARMSDA